MKKLKVFLVSLLTVVMAMFCLGACGQQGKYEAVSYKLLGATVDISGDDASYVELKSKNEAVVSITIASMTWEGTGTWEKGEEKNTVVITIDGVSHNATVEDGKMTLDMGVGSIIFEK